MDESGRERGKQYNFHLANQPRDFSGLRYGNITPTDIDALMEFGGKLFVLIEAKLPNAPLPHGQRQAIERLIDAISRGGCPAIGIVCEHGNRDGAINFAECCVTEFRWRKRWRYPSDAISVKQAIDKIRQQVLGKPF